MDLGWLWEEKGWVSRSEVRPSPCVVMAGAQWYPPRDVPIQGVSKGCTHFSWCRLGRCLMGAGCPGMSWAQSRGTSGGLLVVWSHGGRCLSVTTMLTLPSRSGKRSRPWQLGLRMEFSVCPCVPRVPCLQDRGWGRKGVGARWRVWLRGEHAVSESTVNMCCGDKWHAASLPAGKVNR